MKRKVIPEHGTNAATAATAVVLQILADLRDESLGEKLARRISEAVWFHKIEVTE